jgi:hypothetical protein
LKKFLSVFFLIFITGCSLGGDFTPPPAIATSQAAPSSIQPTESPLPTATIAEESAGREQDALEEVVTQGNVHGVVGNGSAGGFLPDGLEVNLYGFDGQQEVVSETTTTDETGKYQFEGLENLPGRVFIVTAEYQGIIYASEVAHFMEEDELDLPITIFESTPNLNDLQVDRLHVIIDMPNEGVMQVTELWIISNLGDRTISSETGEGILAIEIPDGATNLSFESGMAGTRFQGTAGGFIDLYPVYPGEGSHEIVFSFNMLIDKSLDFSQPVAFPVEAAVMLTPEEILVLNGEGIQDMGIRQMSGIMLHNYSMGPITAGDSLEFLVERESGSGVVSSDSGSAFEIALGAVFLMAALGGTGFWLYRRKKENEADLNESLWSEVSSADPDTLDDRDEILQTMADLDDAYEAQQIQYASYQKRRNALKTRLMEIMKREEND